MDSLEKIVAEKEEELKTLACELAEALKDRDNKLEFIKQAEKTIPILEKRLKRKTEMLTQEKQDNELIQSKISSLSKGRPDLN